MSLPPQDASRPDGQRAECPASVIYLFSIPVAHLCHSETHRFIGRSTSSRQAINSTSHASRGTPLPLAHPHPRPCFSVAPAILFCRHLWCLRDLDPATSLIAFPCLNCPSFVCLAMSTEEDQPTLWCTPSCNMLANDTLAQRMDAHCTGCKGTGTGMPSKSAHCQSMSSMSSSSWSTVAGSIGPSSASFAFTTAATASMPSSAGLLAAALDAATAERGLEASRRACMLQVGKSAIKNSWRPLHATCSNFSTHPSSEQRQSSTAHLPLRRLSMPRQ